MLILFHQHFDSYRVAQKSVTGIVFTISKI